MRVREVKTHKKGIAALNFTSRREIGLLYKEFLGSQEHAIHLSQLEKKHGHHQLFLAGKSALMAWRMCSFILVFLIKRGRVFTLVWDL